MKVELTCLYCDHKWVTTIYSQEAVENEKCSICEDTNLKVRDLTAAKIDGYKGCPPFPEKKKPTGWPPGSGWMD